jgi:hypothetical protein
MDARPIHMDPPSPPQPQQSVCVTRRSPSSVQYSPPFIIHHHAYSAYPQCKLPTDRSPLQANLRQCLHAGGLVPVCALQIALRVSSYRARACRSRSAGAARRGLHQPGSLSAQLPIGARPTVADAGSQARSLTCTGCGRADRRSQKFPMLPSYAPFAQRPALVYAYGTSRKMRQAHSSGCAL